MKNIAYALQLAFTIFATFAFFTFIGLKTGHVVIGIFVGFFCAIAYLFKIVFDKK